MDDFQIAKVKPWVLLSTCLIFFQFQLDVAYKSVAYKNKACIDIRVIENFLPNVLRNQHGTEEFVGAIEKFEK